MSPPIPKVREVLATWRKYPTEIAYDLSVVHHRHIGEWHRGEMSSRELIELIEPLPCCTSAFKIALRGGDWCIHEYTAARAANEAALARADGRGYMPELIKSPAQEHEEADRQSMRRKAYERSQAVMRGDKSQRRPTREVVQ